MKKYTTIKTGYSSGVYGCSGEYFTTIVINGDKTDFFHHKGLYGSEERVNQALKDKGYEFFLYMRRLRENKNKRIPERLVHDRI